MLLKTLQQSLPFPLRFEMNLGRGLDSYTPLSANVRRLVSLSLSPQNLKRIYIIYYVGHGLDGCTDVFQRMYRD